MNDEEDIYTDRLNEMQYRKNPEGDIWYRRLGDEEWTYAGNFNDPQTLRLPIEYVSLVARGQQLRQSTLLP